MLYYVSSSSITFTNSCEQYVVKQLYLVMSTVMKWWAMAHQMRTMKTVGSKAIVRETQPTYALWRCCNMIWFTNLKCKSLCKMFFVRLQPSRPLSVFQSFDVKPAIKDFYYELDDRKLWGLGALAGKRQAGEVENIDKLSQNRIRSYQWLVIKNKRMQIQWILPSDPFPSHPIHR